jgi:beta-glucosidase
MSTIEKQAEDLPYDVQCYKDSEGNVYDFGFGMNWKGVIKDGRGLKFRK